MLSALFIGKFGLRLKESDLWYGWFETFHFWWLKLLLYIAVIYGLYALLR